MGAKPSWDGEQNRYLRSYSKSRTRLRLKREWDQHQNQERWIGTGSGTEIRIQNGTEITKEEPESIEIETEDRNKLASRAEPESKPATE
ncbi:hypothetical protein EVAR_24295_1 [Eumeta japonica]|uniref:Uncharacterized protein n=1 Tax=Eumeta variegata TaxID=151549 RepID=A0A4C1VEX4_EUMVA|nr:hypothetical protein EVAR_24295_1 [Eumeta japonica]